jgi:hypothetical protein
MGATAVTRGAPGLSAWLRSYAWSDERSSAARDAATPTLLEVWRRVALLAPGVRGQGNVGRRPSLRSLRGRHP